MQETLLLFCLFLVTILPCHGASSRLEPLSYVALLNQEYKAMFNCTVHGANYASWEINNEPDLVHKESEIQRRGIETTHERIAGTQRSYFATLKLSPSEINHYTEIKCWAAVRDGMGRSVASETAIFQVQGFLSKPQNITSAPLNLTHTRIVWLPPFTLNVTDIEPDIQQYTVCAHIGSIHSHYCVNSTARELILPNLNVNKEVNVSAWNSLGKGETAELSVDACEPQDQDPNDAKTVVEVGELTEIDLFIAFRNDLNESICFCLYNLTLTLNDTLTHFGYLSPTIFWSNGYSILVPANLFPNELYRAELICVTGETSNTTNTTLHFSSFDVQDVTLTINEENLTLLICCEFALGSQAEGCHVYIIITDHTEHQQQQQNITRNLTQHGTTSCWEENDISPGITYTITVYDWEMDGSIDLRKPVYSADVFVNASYEDHNTEWSTLVPTTMATTEPKKEAAITAHSTSLTEVSVVEEISSPSITFIIVVACGSVAVILFIVLAILTVCCCVLVKRKRGVVYSISAPREFIYRSNQEANLEEDGNCFEMQQVDSLCQTHSSDQQSTYRVISKDNMLNIGYTSTNTHTTMPYQVNTSPCGSDSGTKLNTPNGITNPLTLSQCMTDTQYHPQLCHSSHFTQVDTSRASGKNTFNSPEVHCPVYDHTKMPVYDQIVQPSSQPPVGSSATETFTINNDTYSSADDTMLLERNASYVCPHSQKQKRKLEVSRGPLPPLPLETSQRGRNTPAVVTAAVYETVSDA